MLRIIHILALSLFLATCLIPARPSYSGITEYTYDHLNRLKRVDYKDANGNIESKIEYDYDEIGNMIEATHYPALTITATALAGGSISPSGAVGITSGGSQTFYISTDAGYHITDVQVDGVSQGAITSYAFTNVTTTHTITANFAIDTFTITATAGANGTVTPAGASTVNYGSSPAYNITPTAGYHVADVQVDGVSKGATSSYTFSNVTAGHSISATFATNTCTTGGNPVRISGRGDYATLQAAYNAAAEGDTILSQATTFTENLTANRNISVTLVGGYANDYVTKCDPTNLKGKVWVDMGKVKMRNVRVMK